MALQNSGTITLDQVGQEFRGPKPYDLDSHHRGGGKVPATRPGTMNPPTGGNPTRDGFIPTTRCDATGPWSPKGNCSEQQQNTAGCAGPAIQVYARTFTCPGLNAPNIVTLNAYCHQPSGAGGQCGERWDAIGPYSFGGAQTMTGHQYRTGSDPAPNPPGPNPPGPNPPNPVVPGFMNPPIPINTGVPTSGTIKLDDFYGARR